jgi:hypothetical protein
MLGALHMARTLKATPVYGMRLPDSVGALGNTFQVTDLEDRLRQARRISIHPLKAEATTWHADTMTCFAINEIVLSRARLQTAKLRVNVEGLCSGQRLIGDGLVISTAIGSEPPRNPTDQPSPHIVREQLSPDLARRSVARALSLEVPLSDSTIRDKLLAHLKSQNWAHADLLNVTVNGGVVDLWGIVTFASKKNAIRVAAEATPGVRTVNDNLRLLPSRAYA